MCFLKRLFGKKEESKATPEPIPVAPEVPKFKVVTKATTLPIKRKTITILKDDGDSLVKTIYGSTYSPARRAVSLVTGLKAQGETRDRNGDLLPLLADVDFGEHTPSNPNLDRDSYEDWGQEYRIKVDSGDTHIIQKNKVKEVVISAPFDAGDVRPITITYLEPL